MTSKPAEPTAIEALVALTEQSLAVLTAWNKSRSNSKEKPPVLKQAKAYLEAIKIDPTLAAADAKAFCRDHSKDFIKDPKLAWLKAGSVKLVHGSSKLRPDDKALLNLSTIMSKLEHKSSPLKPEEWFRTLYQLVAAADPSLASHAAIAAHRKSLQPASEAKMETKADVMAALKDSPLGAMFGSFDPSAMGPMLASLGGMLGNLDQIDEKELAQMGPLGGLIKDPRMKGMIGGVGQMLADAADNPAALMDESKIGELKALAEKAGLADEKTAAELAAKIGGAPAVGTAPTSAKDVASRLNALRSRSVIPDPIMNVFLERKDLLYGLSEEAVLKVATDVASLLDRAAEPACTGDKCAVVAEAPKTEEMKDTT